MKKRQRNKPRPSNIGRRTGVDVVRGKNIRSQDDGTDVFEDYWTDSDSNDSNQAFQSKHSSVETKSDKISKNVSILDRDSVRDRNAPISSRIKTLNQRSGEYEDHNGYFRPEHSKRSEISEKKFNFFEEIGRRTGVNVVEGKKIRKQDDGTDVYDDYLTDSDLVDSNQAIQPLRSSVKTGNEGFSENVSFFNRDQGSLKFEDHDGFSSPEQSKRSEISRKKSHFFEDVEISAIARSKMTQTSHLLDETETTPSKNRTHMHKKFLESNGADISDSKMNSSVRKSPKILSNSSLTLGRREYLPMSRDDRNAAWVSFSDEMNSGKKVNNKRNSEIMTQTDNPLDESEVSPFKDRTNMPKTFYSEETEKNKTHSSVGERNSPVETSSVLSEISHVPNRKENLHSSRGDTRVSLSSKMESEKKAKYKRNSRVMSQTSHPLDGTEGSPFRNRTNTPKTSYSENTAKNKANSPDCERDSPVEASRVLFETSHVPNRREDLPSSRDDTRVSLSSKMESGKKAKDKRNSRVMTQTSHPFDGTEGSSFRNRTYTPKTSYSKDTGKNNADSSDSERDSPVETSRVLSESSRVPNRMEDLPSSKDDTRAAKVSFSRKMKSEKKAKDKRNSRVMTRASHQLYGTEGSPFKNKAASGEGERNFSVERSSRVLSKTLSSPNSKKDVNNADSSDSERDSPVETSRVLSESSHVPNRREDLPSSKDDTRAAKVSFSRKMESEKKANDKRNSRVMTRASHQLYGTEGSPFKNKAASGEGERTFSEERSSEVLSKTLSSPNSNKEVNKRKSSLRRTPQHSAKSSEVLNEKERKSSVGLSPIAIKRKMVQIPDTLENSPSKTSCVQNRWEEGNEKNFSGEDSRHHTSKSEVLNRKKNRSSRSNYSVNRSEILVSCQKENDEYEDNQKSSAEKSPRASESRTKQTSDPLENRQVSSTADSRMKTASQDALQENASSPCKGLRRSTRYRRPPLASWRNERLKFVKASAEKEYECVGVEDGLPEDDFAFRRLKKRFESGVKKRKVVSWKKRTHIPKHIKKTPIINERTEKVIELYLHRPFSSYEWTLPLHEDNPGYMITRTFKSKYMTFGFLDIAGHSMKDRQHSPQDNLHFVVVKGVVEAVINKTSFTFQKGDSFIVPVGTSYSISNETSRNALLNFTSFKIPFFAYQEND